MSKIKREDGKSSIEEYTGAETEEGFESGSRRGRDGRDERGGLDGRGGEDTDTGSYLDPNQDPSVPDDESEGKDTSDGSLLEDYAKLYRPIDESFKFLECDPVEQVDDKPPCPVCRPNPYAYVPDYRMMENGEVFFNGKDCTQNIVLTFDAPANSLVNAASSFQSTSMIADNLTPEITNKIESTGPTVSELKSRSFMDEKKEVGVRKLLDYFNKARQATALIYRPVPRKEAFEQGVTAGRIVGSTAALAFANAQPDTLALLVGATRSVVVDLGYGDLLPKKKGYKLSIEGINIFDELTKYARYEYHVPLQLKARTRVLISIPVEQFNRAPDRLISEPETDFEDKLEVTFMGNDINGMIKRTESAFRVYDNELKRWRGFEGGKLVETDSGKTSGFSLASEADKLVTFKSELADLMEDLGFSLDPFKPGKRPEKILIKFKFENEKYSIRQIHVNLPGCPVVKVGPRGRFRGLYDKYTKKSPFNRSRTLHYIGALPEIDIALTARTPMPWLEVTTKFTYPPLEIQNGINSNTMFNDPTMLGCLINSNFADERVDDFFNDITGLLDGFDDLFLAKLGEFSCKTRDQLQDDLNVLQEFDNVFKTQSKRVMAQLQRELRQDDPYLDIVIQEMFPAMTAWGKLSPQQQAAEIKKHGSLKAAKQSNAPEDVQEKFFVRLNDRLGHCGWISLIMAAIDCVAQGIAGEAATKLLAEAAFDAMEDAALTRSFLGLSPEAQQKVVDSMRNNFGDMPAPWDTDYQPGNYTGAGFTVSPLNAEQKKFAREEGGSEAVKEARKKAREDADKPPKPNSQRGSGGTYGRALGGVNKEAYDALKQSMFDALGAEELLEAANQLPGAPIISQILKRLPCRQTPLIYSEPKLDSFLGTVEFDFCQWDAAITLPKFGVLDIKDIFTILLKALEEAIIETAIAIAMQLVKLILEKIFSLACDALALLGANLLDLTNGNNHFRDLLKDNLCPDASQEDMNETIKNLFDALGDPDQDCLERLTNDEMGDFIDDISLMLTQGQICQLLKGNPNEETMKMAMELAQTSGSECIRDIFSDPNAFRDFFKSLAPFIPNLNELCDNLLPNAGDLDVYPCAPGTAEKIEEFRCDLLQQKGLTKEECRDILDDLKDKALMDLADLADAMQNGPFGNTPPMRGDPDADAGCPATGFFPDEHPLQKALNNNISKSMMESIEKAHLKDLWGNINKATGQGGFLNAVLSDTLGRPYKQHNWYVQHFGSPLAADLGFFDYHCDNAIAKPKEGNQPGADKKPINVFGEELGGEEGGKSGRQSFAAGYSHGGYPPTVAAHLSSKFKNMHRNATVSTRIKPPGFRNIEEALDEFKRVQRVNEKRIDERSKYIEAWIREYEVEDKTAPKKAVLAQDLRSGISKKIFFEREAKDEDTSSGLSTSRKINPKNSPADLVREVLLGKQVLGGVGKPGEKGVPDRSGTKGELFIDFYAGKHKLLDLPDTSSADIILKYTGYSTDAEDGTPPYEFSIEYDYNLFDEETQRIVEDNRYQIKVMETYRTAKPSGKTKKELRQIGNQQLAASIYQTGKSSYTFPRYQFEVVSAPPGDIADFLDSLTDGSSGEPLSRPSGDPPNPLGNSFEVEALYNFFRRQMFDISTDDRTANRIMDRDRFKNYFAKKDNVFDPTNFRRQVVKANLFDQLSTGFLQRISTLVSTGNPNDSFKNRDDGDLSNNEEKLADKMNLDNISRAFQFGYNPDRQAKIIELDPLKYGGPIARAFPDSTPPPFYVKSRRFKGWLDLCDTLVPEVAGCAPESKAIYNLEDLSDLVSSLESELKADPRLQNDPLCSQEAPYDKILSSFDAANLEASMRAVIRIYTLDVFLRTIPVFTAFALTEDNYDDLMLAFVVERMKQGLQADGVKLFGAPDETYYYRFLEQAVNNTKRKLDAGILTAEDLTDEENAAFDRISNEVMAFYEEFDGELECLSDAAIKGKGLFDGFFSTSAAAPAVGLGAGSNRFNKGVAKNTKDRAFKDFIGRTEQDALLFLRRYIREEFSFLRDKLSNAVPPVVNNVDNLMAISPDWVRGAVDAGGPYNVMGDVTDPTDYVIEADNPRRLSKDTVTDTYWPFVLEKYIRIHEKETPGSEVDRSSNLYDIVNIDDWEAYVKDAASRGVRGDISDLWEGWSFGLRLSYLVAKDDNEIFEKVMDTVPKSVSRDKKAYNVVNRAGKTRYLIPIASGELPIPDQKYDLFKANSYDVYCLIPEMQKTPEFRTMFKYIFPLPRFISLVAMYSTMGFTASIGNSGYPKEGGDMWEYPGGYPNKKYRKWNHSPQKAFERSRQAARRVFESFYEAAQALDFDMSSDRDPKNSADALRGLIRPKVNFEDGLRWWERGLRVKGNPYNDDGDLCD